MRILRRCGYGCVCVLCSCECACVRVLARAGSGTLYNTLGYHDFSAPRVYWISSPSLRLWPRSLSSAGRRTDYRTRSHQHSRRQPVAGDRQPLAAGNIGCGVKSNLDSALCITLYGISLRCSFYAHASSATVSSSVTLVHLSLPSSRVHPPKVSAVILCAMHHGSCVHAGMGSMGTTCVCVCR